LGTRRRLEDKIDLEEIMCDVYRMFLSHNGDLWDGCYEDGDHLHIRCNAGNLLVNQTNVSFSRMKKEELPSHKCFYYSIQNIFRP
jgi:hypothetical protein